MENEEVQKFGNSLLTRERLSVKGSCHGNSKLCCDTPWKRRKLKHRSVLNYQKLWEKNNKHSNSVNISDFQKCCPLNILFPFCWISGSYPSPKCILWVIYSWLLCFCEVPCYQVLELKCFPKMHFEIISNC